MKSKGIVVGAFIVVGLLTMNAAVAGEVLEEVDVDINRVEELNCGEQQMNFSGYVDLHEGHELIVELDDNEIANIRDKTSWWTELHTVVVGNHTLYAYVTNSASASDEGLVEAVWDFEIEECPTPTPTPTPSEEPKDEGSNDPGDEQDCETSTKVDACGEGYTNEEPESPAPVGRVKGVVEKAVSTPTPEVVQKLDKFPEAGPSALLPLMLAGSWFSVAVVGFRNKW